MRLFSILGLLTACSTELPAKLDEDSAVDTASEVEEGSEGKKQRKRMILMFRMIHLKTQMSLNLKTQKTTVVKMSFRKQTVLSLLNVLDSTNRHEL